MFLLFLCFLNLIIFKEIVFMNAYDFIINGVSNLIKKDDFYLISSCKFCKRDGENLLGVNRTCMTCYFLQTPNPEYFGMLTSVRAHSPISFLNSLLVFDSKDGMSLVTSQKYADKIPSTEHLKVIVGNNTDYIIELLNNPRQLVLLKPSIRYEDYASKLIISDERAIYLLTPNGGYWLNIETWNNLIILFSKNDIDIIYDAIDLITRVSIGKIKNTDTELRKFIKDNRNLVIKMNELLDMDIHSKVFMLKLLKTIYSVDQKNKAD